MLTKQLSCLPRMEQYQAGEAQMSLASCSWHSDALLSSKQFMGMWCSKKMCPKLLIAPEKQICNLIKNTWDA